MKLRSPIAGFGLLQVMIGTVVLGIFAMVFVRKAYNRADVGLLTELITYRDQVLDYYSAVVQSRTAWQCTRKCNSLQPVSIARTFKLYDGDGDCQHSCPPTTSSTPTLRIPINGWRFSLSDNNFAFSPPSWARSAAEPSGTGNTDDTHPFFVKTEWQEVSPTTKSVKVTISIFFSPSDNWKAKHTSLDIGDRHRVFYMNRTPYKNCSDGLAARFGGNQFYNYTGTSGGVRRYAGDTAIVEIDATTGLVQCWDSPLVIPPCYRHSNTDPYTAPFNIWQPSSDTDSVSSLDFVAAQPCQGIDQGLCPRTAGLGTTGITHFDKFTGVSHCAKDHILMVEGSDGRSDVDCGSVNSGGLVGISNSGEFICSNPHTTNAIAGRGGVGVRHNEGQGNQYPYYAGIKGWDGSGNIRPANYPRGRGDHTDVDVIGTGYYWTGDQGGSGANGTSIECHNCCTYPKLRSNGWHADCCQERYEDCDLAVNANPTCIFCRAARTACTNCKNEFKRDCEEPCEDCRDDKSDCMLECNKCRSDKSDCESECERCRDGCTQDCHGCETTKCSSLSGDARTTCVNEECKNDCVDCRKNCDESSDCTKDCGDCDVKCADEDDCEEDWDNASCDKKCSEDGHSCIGSDLMSIGCRNYDSHNGKCHEDSVIEPACDECDKCLKDKSDCAAKESALRHVRDAITNSDPFHCRDVVSP